MLGSSAKSRPTALAASRTMQSSPASLPFCHGLRLRSRRMEGWPLVASTSLLRHPLVSYIYTLNTCQNNFQSKHPKTNINILTIIKRQKTLFKENHWSLPLRLDSSCLAVNQQENNSPPSRPWALKIAQFPRFPRLATVLDPSSSLPIRRSWLYVGGGGWENQTPQIA